MKLNILTTAVLGVAALALVAGGADAKEWKTIRIATEGAYAPWNFTDASGELIGFELDLIDDLCKRMGTECEVVAQAWDGIIPALQAGKYDAIMAGMSITDKRLKVINFSTNYAQTPAVFVVTKDSPSAGFSTDVESISVGDLDGGEKKALDAIIAEFKGKTIGVQVATTHANFLNEFLAGDVTIRTYDTQENLDLDLGAGRVDTALASMSYWVPLLKSDKGKEMLMVGPGLTGGPFGRGVGVGVRQENPELADMFSKAINEAKRDGTIQRLALQWFGFDVSTKPGS